MANERGRLGMGEGYGGWSGDDQPEEKTGPGARLDQVVAELRRLDHETKRLVEKKEKLRAEADQLYRELGEVMGRRGS